MGVSPKRWQLWLITMFILTGIIGVFQLFEGPKSVGAVTVVGGVVAPSVGLPERSAEATNLPAWQPSASPSESSESRTTTVVAKPALVEKPVPATQTTTRTAPVATPTASQAPSTKSPVISGQVASATAKPTTTQPQATTTTPKPATTTAKPTTTAPKPSATATATGPTTRPTCHRMFFYWWCR